MAGIALPFPRSRSRALTPARPLSQKRRGFGPPAAPASEGVMLWTAASLLFVTVALNFYVFQVSVVATSAYELQRLERERDAWRARNSQLQLELSKGRSLRWVEHEAIRRLGMVKGEKPIYLRVE